jgi:PHD/YefM family antitoxin component YafN of YafNO toxin-antitoxin module
MASTVEATADAVSKQFGHYSDLALKGAVIVTRHGRARTVMISAEEYDRLKRRDREVLDFAKLGEAERQSLIAALQAQIYRGDPALEDEMKDYQP